MSQRFTIYVDERFSLLKKINKFIAYYISLQVAQCLSSNAKHKASHIKRPLSIACDFWNQIAGNRSICGPTKNCAEQAHYVFFFLQITLPDSTLAFKHSVQKKKSITRKIKVVTEFILLFPRSLFPFLNKCTCTYTSTSPEGLGVSRDKILPNY